MPVAAIVGASVIGAGASIVSAKKAAKAATKAADLSVAEQRRQYDQTRADQAPYRETGANALDRPAGLYGVQRTGATAATNADGTPAAYGGFQATPGYQFRRDEGLKAIDHGLDRRR